MKNFVRFGILCSLFVMSGCSRAEPDRAVMFQDTTIFAPVDEHMTSQYTLRMGNYIQDYSQVLLDGMWVGYVDAEEMGKQIPEELQGVSASLRKAAEDYFGADYELVKRKGVEALRVRYGLSNLPRVDVPEVLTEEEIAELEDEYVAPEMPGLKDYLAGAKLEVAAVDSLSNERIFGLITDVDGFIQEGTDEEVDSLIKSWVEVLTEVMTEAGSQKGYYFFPEN